ncbi:hypothetical protein [Nocardioides halotolerans]|uniref:hypothetical protein n=1 Tax=Nocardioides halotolerans TaxID=433660 RepID=UPI00040C7B8A|nr:hypothetical protein [Nocardioides halotolerans]
MQTRRSFRLVAGALVLALPLLGSCGFGKATDRVYTQAAGTNNRDADVHVLSAVIVAAQPDSGTFVASLSNASPKDDNQLTGVSGAGEWSDLTVDPSDLSIDIPARGFVNLVDQDPITVTGDFDAGQVAELTLTFESGDEVTFDVPIVFACNSYEGRDLSQQEPSESASPSDEPSPGDVPTDGATVSPSESASESSSAPAAPQEPYSCSTEG